MIHHPSLRLNRVAFPFATALCVAMVRVYPDVASQVLMAAVVAPILYDYWRIDAGGKVLEKICSAILAVGIMLFVRWWINEVFIVRWERLLPAWLLQTVGERPYLALGIIVGGAVLITTGRGGGRRR